MITELKLSNFRLFDDEVTVRFRPITVLIGQNNSGKSSVIKFLLMLKQSLDRESAQFLNPQDEKVGLGDFNDLKNVSNPTGVGQTLPFEKGEALKAFSSYKETQKQEFSNKISIIKKEDLFFQLTVKEKKSSGDPVVSYIREKYNLSNNQNDIAMFYSTSARVSYQKKHQNVKEHKITGSYNQNSFKLKKEVFDDFKLLDFSNEWKNASYNTSKNKTNVLKKTAEENIVKTLINNINNLYHLLPVRNIGKDSIVSGPIPTVSVGPDGLYTLPHLQKMYNNEDTMQLKFILSHIKEVAGLKGIKFELESIISKCFGVNKLTGAEVLIKYFGFGVSQCLPIFIQGALMPQHSSLMVEQPEVQLHPTAQLELGSFFADLWKKRQVGSIIETHSDNILLRLRRLIAKGDLKPEDVSVAFLDFDTEKQQPVVKNLNIEQDGSMEDGLPMEFFGKNIEEALKMGAGE